MTNITQVGDNIAETFREHSELTARVEQLEAERDKLAAFKEYVHKRLDAANVPHNPEPEANAKNGCRIEGRLNFLEKQLAAVKQNASEWARHWYVLDRERTNLRGRITALRRGLKGLAGPNCLTEIEEYQQGATADLKADDAKRRRFERAEKRR